jgi:hypothetical protein
VRPASRCALMMRHRSHACRSPGISNDQEPMMRTGAELARYRQSP